MKFGFFVLGAAAGAIVYAFFAPKSGSEMREDATEAANLGKRYTREAVAQVKSVATEMADQAKSAVAS